MDPSPAVGVADAMLGAMSGSLFLGGGGGVICALGPAVTPFGSPSVRFSGQRLLLLLLLLGPGLGLHLSPRQPDQPAWWGSISNSLLVLRSSCSALHRHGDWLRFSGRQRRFQRLRPAFTGLTFMTNQLIGLV